MTKVIMRLNGGLGNQMFQYAFAKSLAAQNGASLLLDASMFDLSYTPEKYRLDEFDLRAQFTANWRNQLHRLLLSPKLPETLRRLVTRLLRVEIVRDPERPSTSRATTLLVGYFQHPDAFMPMLDTLRQDFRFSIPGGLAQTYHDQIIACESVAVHIRRGDYVNVAQFRENLGVLSAAYYKTAIAQVSDRVNAPRFFVFTNDPDWVTEHILSDTTNAELVELGPNGRDITEMALMSACRHFIVGNSTFSWWPAVLAPNPEKVVIAPWPWFRASGVNAEQLNLPCWQKNIALWEK